MVELGGGRDGEQIGAGREMGTVEETVIKSYTKTISFVPVKELVQIPRDLSWTQGSTHGQATNVFLPQGDPQ